MSESIQSTLISALPAATKVSDTDIVVLENGSTTQKITIAQLKEALGINALNTNLGQRVQVVHYFSGRIQGAPEGKQSYLGRNPPMFQQFLFLALCRGHDRKKPMCSTVPD